MIAIFLAEGFEEIEALTPLDLLRRANLEVKTVSITNDKCVRGAHGISVIADLEKDELSVSDIDFAIFPGGMPGAKNLDEWDLTDEIISLVLARGKRLGAICAAPMIFGKRGLLSGKRAVCYPGFEDTLKGAEISYLPVVTDGNITTARGMGAALDFSLEIIKILLGEDEANSLAKAIIKEI